MKLGNKEHLMKSLEMDSRIDWRKKLNFREVSVEYGVYKNAEGSSRVKIGGTEVIAGI